MKVSELKYLPELELVEVEKAKTDKEKIAELIVKINIEIDRMKFKKKRR